MRLYSENLKNKFKNLLNEGDLKGDKKRRQFAEQKVLPFLFELMDEIVSNDNLEKLEHEFIEDQGAKMAIIKSFAKSSFCIEKNNFLEKWETQSLESSIEGDLFSVFHEARHHKQHALLGEKNILKMSPYSSIYAKEEMIQLFDYEFYRENHDEFLMEIEADHKAYQGSAEFIFSAMPNSEYAQQYKDLHAPDFFAPISSYFENSEYGIENKSHFITDKFDDILKGVPADQISSVFEDYPILKLVYHEDGTKKSIEEILSMKNEIVKANFNDLQKTIEIDDYTTTIASHINKTFATIIRSDKELSDEYDKYLAKKEAEKASKTDNDNIKQEQKYKPKTEQFYKDTQREKQSVKTFERTF